MDTFKEKSSWSFIEQLNEGKIVNLSDQKILLRTEEEIAQWGASKVVYLPESLTRNGDRLVIKKYRDPAIEDQPRTETIDGITISFGPTIVQVDELNLPLGSTDLSEAKQRSYQLCKQFLGEYVPATFFFLATDEKEKKRNYEAQHFVSGNVMRDHSWELPYSTNGIQSLKELVAKIEQMFIQTGCLPDLHEDILETANIISDALGNCYLVDTDSLLAPPYEIVQQVLNSQQSETTISSTSNHQLILDWISKGSPSSRRYKESVPITLRSLDRAKRFISRAEA